MKAAVHPQELRRIEALRRYDILDTPRERQFDEVVELVAALCDAPIAVVNLIDSDRQWFKAEVGLGVRSTPLDTSLCAHVILEKGFIEIPDTLLDSRMRDNPLCTGDPGLRFYAGATLRTPEGLPIGTLCVLDYKPRTLDPLQRKAVQVIADQVMRQLELGRAIRRLDTLRRESDHRVKNSLSSVSAIVGLQANRAKGEEARAALAAVQHRLAALIALHEELHGAEDGATVDLKRFIERSTEMLGALLPERVSIDALLEPLILDASEAQSIGIIVNEFVANAGKHAFPDGRAGRVTIRGELSDDAYVLRCGDDGVADADTIDRVARSKGLGGRIIAASASSIGTIPRWSSAEPGLALELRLATRD